MSSQKFNAVFFKDTTYHLQPEAIKTEQSQLTLDNGQPKKPIDPMKNFPFDEMFFFFRLGCELRPHTVAYSTPNRLQSLTARSRSPHRLSVNSYDKLLRKKKSKRKLEIPGFLEKVLNSE